MLFWWLMVSLKSFPLFYSLDLFPSVSRCCTEEIIASLLPRINFLDQWEKAIAEGKECHVIGDCNLDFLTWKDPSLPDLSKPDELKPLVNQLFDKIFPFGFVQHVSTATRFWPNTNPSGLDHWYSNQPRKLSEIQVHFHGGSDHKLLFGVRYSKSVIDKPRIVRKRYEFESTRISARPSVYLMVGCLQLRRPRLGSYNIYEES